MVEELGPGQSVRNSVTAVVFDALLDIFSISYAEEAFLFGLVGEVDDDEPRCDGDNLGNKTFNDLLQVRVGWLFSTESTHKDPLPASDTTQSLHLHQTVCQNGRESSHQRRDQIECRQSE